MDAWYDYPQGAKGVTVDPFHRGDPKDALFVVRGGAWWMAEFTGGCSSIWRGFNHSSPANGYRGFRLVLGPRVDLVPPHPEKK